MKTIFRYANTAALMAAFIVLGALAAFAQDSTPSPAAADPCSDAAGQTALSDKVREIFSKTDLDSLKTRIDMGKQYLEKYGACPSAEEFSTYLKTNTPKWEKTYADKKAAAEKKALLDRFDAGMKSKNWDEVYASGREILAKYPDEFSAVELVLGSIGYDELIDRQNSKYSDQTMTYAKQSLADLDAGKQFKPGMGVAPFLYKSKEDAAAWMNLTIGSIYFVGQKNKQAALPYLYKATLAPAASDVSKNPNPYDFIGQYYFDEINKLVEQIKAKAAEQKDTDTPEMAKQKLDEYNALNALLNGTSERAMDAFARAYTLGTKPEYKARMKKNVQDAYKVRFGKDTGVDEWIASTTKKPFVDPTKPVTPITDATPTSPAASTTSTPAPAPAKPTQPEKPTATPVKSTSKPTASPARTAAKPVAKPVANKTVAKKKGA
jgi:hypothetical protein